MITYNVKERGARVKHLVDIDFFRTFAPRF